MLLPFVGGFIFLTLWGSFFQVPGNNDLSGRFARTISDAVGATALAKGIYDLAEAITSTYTAPGHKEFLYIRTTGFPSSAAHVGFPNATGTRKSTISVAIPLWEEADVLQICVDSGPVDRDTAASNSPASSSRAGLVVVWGLLAFIALLWKGLVSFGVSALGDKLGWLGQFLEGTPKVAHYLAADSAPSLYEEVDALVEGKMLSGVAVSSSDVDALTRSAIAAPLEEQQTWGFVSIHPVVEKAISRLERQRIVAVSLELDSCTVNEPKVNPNGVVDGPTDTAQGTSDVVGSSALHPSRKWALVLRRPENLSPILVLQVSCALLAGWESHTASAVPDSPGSQLAEEPEADAEGAPTSGSRRRKRPSQAKRKRYARRLREREEGLNGAADEAPSPSARPTACDPPAPTQSQASLIVGNRIPSQDARHGQFGGPRPAPTPVMGVYPSPYGWQQPMYSQPPPYYYYG
ncbi:hypothetical protein ALT_4579 [Aspergillus lentulus]|uniref:Uncharacterized protein n=1 Tax=Aspergillus lentulus TaxID=293939 RepID=A0AAN4PJE1_ASPLE|nr:hypothetical protein CNMCM6069_003835 [Aspergillus lentulus]KAF4160447.1 hypothetical protein CNMCM6936_003950 [Aspergillus lentulus]KAF4177777.1 hypothetical protein CNMCM8060_005295 [Aspergillus lentulus]KAF4195271.1 hypothetical protein CNMCM8694_006577 [Aspergillus lentulus]KAF4208684.1 hypothetical protein CNMCM8927_009281 [Aspergillus lentulus]